MLEPLGRQIAPHQQRGFTDAPVTTGDAHAVPPTIDGAPGPVVRLASVLDAHLLASPVVLCHGPDPAVAALERALGLLGRGLAIARARLLGRGITFVAIPATAWADPGSRAAVIALKRASRQIGRRSVLLQEAALRREPHLGNVLLVAAAAATPLPARDRIAVVGKLIDEPDATLADLALLVRDDGRDPVAGVLSLVATGVAEVDIRRPIGPMTQVWLRTAETHAHRYRSS